MGVRAHLPQSKHVRAHKKGDVCPGMGHMHASNLVDEDANSIKKINPRWRGRLRRQTISTAHCAAKFHGLAMGLPGNRSSKLPGR